MEITVNSKKIKLGSNRETVKIGFEKACELAGVDFFKVISITFKHKKGEAGEILPGAKIIAFKGTAIKVEQVE